MFRRILLPVDSESAPGVARLAARIAKSGGGRVRACYVVDRAQIRAGGSVVVLRERIREEFTAGGQRALRPVRALCRRLGVPYSELVVEGDVVEELSRAARRFRADLMVVSARRQGRLKALLLGSRVPALVRGAPCPLLLVRRRDSRRAGSRRRAGRA